jgi:transcriptional regulator
MYVPRQFAADDATARQLLDVAGVADLVSTTPDGLLATLLPFVHDPTVGTAGALLGHLARPNDQWRAALGAPQGEALAIVRGSDAYVSPSWYASKAEHGRVVPTWDYLTVHVYGTLVVHDDVDWLRDQVRRLTDKYEAGRGAAGQEVWSVDDAPDRYIEGMLRGIVGVELRITRLEAKAKLSQNRSAADIDGVVAGLTEAGNAAAAADVRRFRSR